MPLSKYSHSCYFLPKAMETASSVLSPHFCLPHFQVSSSPNPFPPLTLIPLHTANTFTHSLSCILVLNTEYTPTQEGFRGGLAGKESACQCRRHKRHGVSVVSIPPGEGNGNPFQYSWLGNPMDREAWWATVHRVAKNQT